MPWWVLNEFISMETTLIIYMLIRHILSILRERYTSTQLHIKTPTKVCKSVQITAGNHENVHTIKHNSNGMNIKKVTERTVMVRTFFMFST